MCTGQAHTSYDRRLRRRGPSPPPTRRFRAAARPREHGDFTRVRMWTPRQKYPFRKEKTLQAMTRHMSRNTHSKSIQDPGDLVMCVLVRFALVCLVVILFLPWSGPIEELLLDLRARVHTHNTAIQSHNTTLRPSRPYAASS